MKRQLSFYPSFYLIHHFNFVHSGGHKRIKRFIQHMTALRNKQEDWTWKDVKKVRHHVHELRLAKTFGPIDPELLKYFFMKIHHHSDGPMRENYKNWDFTTGTGDGDLCPKEWKVFYKDAVERYRRSVEGSTPKDWDKRKKRTSPTSVAFPILDLALHR